MVVPAPAAKTQARWDVTNNMYLKKEGNMEGDYGITLTHTHTHTHSHAHTRAHTHTQTHTHFFLTFQI